MNQQVTREHLFAFAEMAKDWPTVKQAAEMTGVGHSTLTRALNNGHVLCFTTNVKRVDPVSLAAWLASRQRS